MLTTYEGGADRRLTRSITITPRLPTDSAQGYKELLFAWRPPKSVQLIAIVGELSPNDKFHGHGVIHYQASDNYDVSIPKKGHNIKGLYCDLGVIFSLEGWKAYAHKTHTSVTQRLKYYQYERGRGWKEYLIGLDLLDFGFNIDIHKK